MPDILQVAYHPRVKDFGNHSAFRRLSEQPLVLVADEFLDAALPAEHPRIEFVLGVFQRQSHWRAFLFVFD